ncbi:claudin-10 [Periophthalmus magnuspinnatus]|uniref:claudin-10 n=1 Tax=Periophthalmus magnuspinnatus TaxID=409849 RepID=UPI00243714D8|nr:claudin-10 [Periophthalmus magnuspinnatus]
MKIRVVQIWGFLMTVLGWIFVACTMAMEGWKISAIGGMAGSSIVKVAWYWSSLWRSCYTDSTAVSNCYDFPVLWSVEGHIQIVRGLLMAALSLGMLGFVLSMLGMECTYLGGQELSKYKKVYAGGWCHIISGFLSTSGYAVYAQFVSVEYFNPDFHDLKYDLGTPLFLGWVGSAFHMAGGFFYVWSACSPLCGGQEEVVVAVKAEPDVEQNTSTIINKSTTALSTQSNLTSKTRLPSVSELSSKQSDVSGISSRSARSSRTSRTPRSPRTAGSRATSASASTSSSRSGSGSGRSSRSSLSTISESSRSSRTSRSSRSSRTSGSSRSSRTVSTISGISSNTPFVKNSYI